MKEINNKNYSEKIPYTSIQNMFKFVDTNSKYYRYLLLSYGFILLGNCLIGYSISGLSGIFYFSGGVLIILLGIEFYKASKNTSERIIHFRNERNLAKDKFKSAIKKYRVLTSKDSKDSWKWCFYGYRSDQTPTNEEKTQVEFEKDLAKYDMITKEINLVWEIGHKSFSKMMDKFQNSSSKSFNIYLKKLEKKRDECEKKLEKKWWVDTYADGLRKMGLDPYYDSYDKLDYIDLLDVDE